MIVQCDACNTKFRLDDSKVKATGVKVRCTKCQNVFVVMPPSSEEAAPKQEESFEVSFETQSEPASKTTEMDFAKSSDQPPASNQEEKKPAASSWDMSGMDFTFEEKPSKEEKKSEWDIGFTSAKEETSFSFEEKKEAEQPQEEKKEFSFEIGEEPAIGAEKKETAPPPELTGFSFDTTSTPVSEKPPFEIEPPPTEEEFAAPVRQETKTAVVEPASVTPPSQAPAEDLLEESFKETKEASFEAPAEKKSIKTRIITYGAIVLFLAAAAVIYLYMGTGLLGRTGSLPTSQKAMDIIGLKGYYISNTSLGRLFVIEGKLMSNLSAPKEVAGIHGVVFDKSGKQIKDAWVAPGRLISQADLMNISMADLGKRFQDRKGTIPPRGIVPFMIVFPGNSGELAEFSVEVGR